MGKLDPDDLQRLIKGITEALLPAIDDMVKRESAIEINYRIKQEIHQLAAAEIRKLIQEEIGKRVVVTVGVDSDWFYCSHANENPNKCPCKRDCICRQTMCKDK